MTSKSRWRLAWLAGLLATSACSAGADDAASAQSGSGPSGSAGSSGAGPTVVPTSAASGSGASSAPTLAPDAALPSSRPVRRLTRREYNNTLRDLLGDDTRPADTFIRDELAGGFDNIASAQTVSPVLAEQYMVAAEEVARRALPDVLQGLPCAAAADEACARTFITDFGARAWRRPVTESELARLLSVYRVGEQESFEMGLQLALRTLLSSAPFMFRIERGEAVLERPELRRPTSWEMASRLSYLFLGSMPDAELFTQASLDTLKTPQQIEAQARRLLDDPRAHAAVEHFHRQWLSLDLIDRTKISKDTEVFPNFEASLIALLREETERFLDAAFWSEGNGLAEMFTANYSFMNAELAAFYGVSGPTAADFERVEFDPGRRAGIMTQAGLLALHSHAKQTSPTRRGKFVREVLLCQELPPPPADVDTALPEPDPNATTRERVMLHLQGPACSGCHTLIDPIGLGFEHYDAVGLWREEQGGQPVDASGQITGVEFGPAFDGIVDLASQMADSAELRRCLAQQWFRYAYGKLEQTEDEPVLAQLQQSLLASGGNFRELLIELTRTPEFLYLMPQGATP